MIFYIIILLFLLFCLKRFDIDDYSNDRLSSYIVLFFLFFVMSAIRYRMGGDGLFYYNYFEEIPFLSDYWDFMKYGNEYGYQPFWVLLNSLCRTLFDSIAFFQVIHALIVCSGLFWFVYKYSKKPFTVVLVLYLSLLLFYYSFEVQREIIAIVLFLLNISNLEKKRWLNYYLLAFLSILFHISAVVVFFLPAFTYIRFSKKLMYVLLFLSLFLSLIRPFLLEIFRLFMLVESMANKASVYSEFTFSIYGFLAFYLVRVILFLPFGLYVIKSNEQKIEYNWFYSAFLVISVLSQYFVGFERFLNYLFPLYIVIVVRFLYNDYRLLTNYFYKVILAVTLFLHIFFILDYKLFIINPYGQHYYSIFFPYNSIIGGEMNKEREDYFINQ